MDLILADHTGPVNVTLWDEIAVKFGGMLRPKGAAGAAGQLLRLEGLRVSDIPKSEWNGTCLTPVKVLHSLADLPGQQGTVLSFPTSAKSPFMLTSTYTPPPPLTASGILALCVPNYLRLFGAL